MNPHEEQALVSIHMIFGVLLVGVYYLVWALLTNLPTVTTLLLSAASVVAVNVFEVFRHAWLHVQEEQDKR